MKKSEVVEFVLDQVCESWELNKDKMLEIIDLLTQSGMLPPYVYSELFGFEPESKWEKE